MATPEQVKIVAGLHQNFSERDPDEFVKHVKEDAVLHPSFLITGRNEYHGPDDVRTGFEEVAALLDSRGEDITIVPVRYYVDKKHDERVMSLCDLTIIRADGEQFKTEIAYLWELDGDMLSGLNSWLSFDEGLQQLDEPEEVPVPA
jgi:hypothetical protein